MSTYVDSCSGPTSVSSELLVAENSKRPPRQKYKVNDSSAVQSTSNNFKSHPFCNHNGSTYLESKQIPNQFNKRRKKNRPKASGNYDESNKLREGLTHKPSRNPKFPQNIHGNAPSSSGSYSFQQKGRRTSSYKEVKRNSTTHIRRFDAPIEVSLYDLIIASEKRKSSTKVSTGSKLSEERPVVRGGKTREEPKSKRPTKLKRAIMDERVARKNRRCSSVPASARIHVQLCEHSQRSSNGLGSKVVTNEVNSQMQKEISPGISIEKYQSSLVSDLLSKLAHFQDRAYVNYLNSPFHQKRAKRFVCGLREVTKYLKLNSLKVIIVARDLEGKAVQNLQKQKGMEIFKNGEPQVDDTISSDRSVLEDILSKIWDLATLNDHPTPILITHTRKQLGLLCHKPSPVSIIGILSFEGALDIAKKLLGLYSAVNIPFKTDSKSDQQPSENSRQHTNIDSPVLVPVSEKKRTEFDMVEKLREAVKQLYFRENDPMSTTE